MATTRTKSNQLALVVTTDSNGWTVYDWGTHKQYRKKGQTQTSLSAGAWNFVNFTTLPTGMSTIGTNFVEVSAVPSDAAISVSPGMGGNGATTVSGGLSNQYGGAVNNFWVYWSVCITTV